MPVQRLGTYDSPRPLGDWYDAPRAPRPASADSACSGTGSLTSATSSASANSGSSAHSAASGSSTYDVPRSRALPLPCDAALEALERLQVSSDSDTIHIFKDFGYSNTSQHLSKYLENLQKSTKLPNSSPRNTCNFFVLFVKIHAKFMTFCGRGLQF